MIGGARAVLSTVIRYRWTLFDGKTRVQTFHITPFGEIVSSGDGFIPKGRARWIDEVRDIIQLDLFLGGN